VPPAVGLNDHAVVGPEEVEGVAEHLVADDRRWQSRRAQGGQQRVFQLAAGWLGLVVL
jgi:hypothetical protein